MATFQPSQHSHLPVVHNPAPADSQKPPVSAGAIALTVGVVGGIILFPGFIALPWMIKLAVPEWSYSKRLGVSLLTLFAVGSATRLVQAGRK